jgi:Uncharacterized protein conserved in bacteria (DUF2252)
VLAAVAAYRRAMRGFAGMDALDVWYAHADVDRIEAVTSVSLGAHQRKSIARTVAKAQTKDNLGALGRFAAVHDGVARMNAEPPLVVPIRDLVTDPAEAGVTEDALREVVRDYGETLEPERRVLLERYRLVDMARKVVGVGSVGTRSWMLLLLEDAEHPLFLQAKEVGPSVLEAYVRWPAPMPGPGTASRWLPTSAAAPPSTWPSGSSLSRTRTRSSVITSRWWTRSRRAGSALRRGCDRREHTAGRAQSHLSGPPCAEGRRGR